MDFSNTRISLDRPLASYARVQAAYSALIRNRLVWSNAAASKSKWLYLNAGCGPNIAGGFLNVDYTWRPGIDLCWDLTKPLPLPTASLKGIFTEHCLEHIPKPRVGMVLAEFRRLLAADGCLRIVLPDAELYIELYNRSRRGESVQFPYVPPDLPAGWTPIEAVNSVFRDHGHQFAYDFMSLRAALLAEHFSRVERCGFRSGRDPALLLDSEPRSVESFYAEAFAT